MTIKELKDLLVDFEDTEDVMVAVPNYKNGDPKGIIAYYVNRYDSLPPHGPLPRALVLEHSLEQTFHDVAAANSKELEKMELNNDN